MINRTALQPGKFRNSQLAKIHKAKKSLGLDESTYRALLMRVTGKNSCAYMTSAERNLVIADFVRLGFKYEQTEERKAAFAGKPKNLAEVPMLKKVEALLADSRRPWSYAHAMAKQMFSVVRVEWLRPDQLHKLVSALQVDANRRSKKDA